MRFKPLRLGFALLAFAGASTEATAQAAAQGAPGQDAPQTDVQGSGTLSSKLSNSGGVIHPQSDVDPGIHKPAPDAGASVMPVIPPPGTPASPAAPQPK